MRQMNLDDDDIVQYAIDQYLMDEGTEADQVTVWEALKNQQPDMDQDLQRFFRFENFLFLKFHLYCRAIQESLADVLNRERNENHDNNENGDSNDARDQPPCLPMNNVIAPIANGNVPSQVHHHQRLQNDIDPLAQDLEIAIRLSQQEKEDEEKRLKEEEELLQQILKLSETEK